MAGCPRFFLAFLIVFSLVTGLSAQVVIGDRPVPYVPLKQPTQKELDRRAALHQYVLGLLYEKDDRVLEALLAFEEAAKLDPEAPAVYKAQVPLLVAVDRGKEALAASTRIVELDPGDYEAWYIHARLLKAQGKFVDARKSLQRGLDSEVGTTHPEVAQEMYFELGNLLELEGSLKAAGEAYGQATKILDHPDHLLEVMPFTKEMIQTRAAEIYERMGHLYRKAKLYDQAISAYQKAQARFPAAPGRIHFDLAQVFLEQGKTEQALLSLDNYLRNQPQGMEAYEMKLKLMQQQGHTQEIVPWLEQASQGDPYNVALKLLLADQYVLAKDSQKAEKIYLDLGQKSPEIGVYRGLFRLYRQDVSLGLGKVLDLFNKTLEQAAATNKETGSLPAQARAMIGALREDADISKDILRLALQRIDARQHNLKFETVHFLALLADRHRQTDEAERFYRQALRQARPETEAIAYSGLLRTLWKAHKYDAVIQLCREGLQNAQATKRILFHNDLARALARLDRYKEALQEVDRAVDLAADTERLTVRHLRVRILTQMKNFDQAEAECLAMLKEHALPSDIMEIRYLLSNVYSTAKQHAKAEEQLDWILRMDGSNPTANNDLGYLWADQGKNLKEAEEMIRKAIDQERRQRKLSRSLTQEEDQDNAAYIDSLGWVLFRRGRVDEARKELERATALDSGDDPTIWDHLGDVYLRLQMYPQARTAYEKALHIYEQERRTQQEDRYRDLQRKLNMVKQQVGAR